MPQVRACFTYPLPTTIEISRVNRRSGITHLTPIRISGLNSLCSRLYAARISASSRLEDQRSSNWPKRCSTSGHPSSSNAMAIDRGGVHVGRIHQSRSARKRSKAPGTRSPSLNGVLWLLARPDKHPTQLQSRGFSPPMSASAFPAAGFRPPVHRGTTPLPSFLPAPDA